MENKEEILLITDYVYERVKKSDIEIKIPKTPIFFQEYNFRTVIGLFPQFATWSDNSVWEIQIIKITEKEINRTFIRTNASNLSDLISRVTLTGKNSEELLREKVVFWLKNRYGDDIVSKETFIKKYEQINEKLSELIYL